MFKAPTEQLQIWHRSKPIKVSPIKFSSNVSVSGNINFCALAELPHYAPIFDVLEKNIFDIDEANYKKVYHYH